MLCKLSAGTVGIQNLQKAGQSLHKTFRPPLLAPSRRVEGSLPVRSHNTCSWLRPESEESRITGLFLRGTKSLKELRTTNWFFSQNILIRLPNTAVKRGRALLVVGLEAGDKRRGPCEAAKQLALLLVVGLEAGDKRRASRGCETVVHHCCFTVVEFDSREL